MRTQTRPRFAGPQRWHRTAAPRTPPRAPPRAASSTATTFSTSYQELTIPSPRPGPPAQDIVVGDITAEIQAAVTASGVQEGTATIISKHTTVGLTVNESESLLEADLRAWLLTLAPPDERSAAATAENAGVRYQHNDIDRRPATAKEADRCRANGWDVDRMDGPTGLAAWRAQEPMNAHAHLAAILVGASVCIPVHKGALAIGQWQSVLVVDCDGPRERRVGVQVMGV